MELGVLEVLRIILGLVLIFFLPGYLLVKALFPGQNELDKEYNLIYEIGLGMGLSIVIAILDGFLLGSLHQLIGFRIVDGAEKGWFDTPFIVSSLLLICLLLFAAGWYRGAFPWMGRLHPSLTRVPASEGPKARKERMDNLIKELWDLSRDREQLRREVRDFERKSRAHAAGMKAHYRKRLDESRRRLEEVDKKMKELEDRRADELAGVEEERARRRAERDGRRREGGLFGLKKGAAPAGKEATGEALEGEKLAEEKAGASEPEEPAAPERPVQNASPTEPGEDAGLSEEGRAGGGEK
jgi:hypothetical protein